MQEEGKNILGNSSGFLCASLKATLLLFFFLVRFSGFGRREVDKPSLSLSLFLRSLSLSLALPTGLGEI